MARIETLIDYYADPCVRARIHEYAGGSADEPPTSVYVAALQESEGPQASWDRAPRSASGSLDRLLARGADIARSMWDTTALLIHLDIDYLNIDAPGEAYHHPAEVFFKLEPVYRATEHVLRRFGLPLFALMTGQGYHFTGRVPLDSAVVDRLALLVPERPGWLAAVDSRRPSWVTARISDRHARAHVAVGMLAEFLTHRILLRARRRSPVPIVLNGTVVGDGFVGRECVSLDISYAGDPLDVRHVRMAFGAYQKHRLRPDLVQRRGASERPPFIAVPRGDEPLAYLLSRGRDLRHAARTARTGSAVLPIVADGIARVMAAYERSSLGAFHRRFYSTRAHALDDLDAVFKSVPLETLPACVVHPLVEANDRLLQPAVIQHVTRALMAGGMQPREIAAVVHSRYARDFGWARRWFWLDAQTRAEFDVRVFAGLMAVGIDGALDFNCRSAQEKGLCPGTTCGRDLRVDRARLLERVLQ